MVNAVNGQGHGPHVRAYSGVNQSAPTPEGETGEPTVQTQHPGKGKAGAPGQMAKQMLNGAPPVGFALGSLVSLIAQGDVEGAQNLADSLAQPPAPAEALTTVVTTVDAAPEPTTIPQIADADSDATVTETVAQTTEPAASDTTDPTGEESPVPVVDVIDTLDQNSEETSIVDLFDSLADDEETV